MTPDPVALFALVILLLPIAYLLLAAPAFLLVKLEIPAVAQLLRGMFNVYFVMLSIAGVIAAAAFATEGRIACVIGIGLIAAFAFWARGWFLQEMDAQIRHQGDADAARRLRRLHWGGMVGNAIQLVAIMSAIPYIAAA